MNTLRFPHLVRWLSGVALLWVATASYPALAFDMAATMTAGGWQEREEVTTNAKGKVTGVNVVWVGVVGTKVVDGVDHIWLEIRNQEYKQNRKGERKAKGKPMAMKSLIETSALADMNNPSMEMRKFGKEIYMQNGNEAPIRMTEGGMMANMAMQALGAEMDFSFQSTNATESITVPAGTFKADKYLGSGSAQVKALVRTMRVETEIESWMSRDVPLGVVQQKTKNTTNGKVSYVTSTLLSYGSGATSAIDDSAAQDMPKLPGLNLPFGNKQ